MDEIKEIEEVKQRYEKYKGNAFAYPDFYRAWQDIGILLSHIKELEERQKWIDEVARPTHPDDERPWCSAYLDCRAKIKELENIEAERERLSKLLIEARMRIVELVEGIGKVLKWRGLDGDGISDPLRKELYELVGRRNHEVSFL